MTQKPSPQTTDRLRRDIDKGKTGEKVDWPDPAAAPLGTDAEAAGHPPGKQAIRSATPASPMQTPRHNSTMAALTYIVLATALLIVIALIVLGAR